MKSYLLPKCAIKKISSRIWKVMEVQYIKTEFALFQGDS